MPAQGLDQVSTAGNMKELRRFSRNTLIYLSSNILRAALPFLLLPFLVRELGPEQYGRIGLITSAFALLLPVIGLGTHAYVRTMFNRSTEEELRRILGAATVMVAVACVVVCLLIFGLGSFVALPLPAALLVVGALAAFGQKVVSIRLVLWQMSGRPEPYGLLSVALSLANLLFSIGLVFLAQMQAEGRILGMWLPAVLAVPLILVPLYRGGHLELSLPRDLVRRMLRFGLPLIPHNLALLFIVFVERAVLADDRGGISLGLFFAAFQMALPVAILSRSINLQFRAYSERLMVDGEHRRVVTSSYGVMAVLAAAALAYAWLLGFVYGAIVGEEMAEGYPIAVMLVFAAMFRGFYLVVVKGVHFTRRTRPLMGLTLCLSALFTLLLLQFRDLYAVAWLNLGFNFALFLCVWILAARLLPQPWLTFLRREGSD